MSTFEKGIFVLGTGCAKCNALEKNVEAALKEMEINEEIHHITDLVEIASYGVMATPALVVDGKVVSTGKTLKVDKVKKLLEENGR